MHAGHGARRNPCASFDGYAAFTQIVEQEAHGAKRAIGEAVGRATSGDGAIYFQPNDPVGKVAVLPVGYRLANDQTVIVAEIRNGHGWSQLVDGGLWRACDFDADMNCLYLAFGVFQRVIMLTKRQVGADLDQKLCLGCAKSAGEYVARRDCIRRQSV